MSQYLVPYFILLTLAGLAMLIGILFSTKPRERTPSYYILIIIFLGGCCAALCRGVFFLFDDKYAFVEYSNESFAFSAPLELFGAILFALTLIYKPFFILSLTRQIKKTDHLYVFITWFLLAFCPAIFLIINKIKFGEIPNLYGTGYVFVALLWFIFELKKLLYKDDIFIKILWVLSIIGCIVQGTYFVVLLLVNSGLLSVDFGTHGVVDFFNRTFRLSLFLLFDFFILLYWLQNLSTQAVTTAENKIKITELLVEKDLLIQNLLNTNALIQTGALSAGLAHEINQFLARIQLDVEMAKAYLFTDQKPQKISSVLDRALEANQQAAKLIFNLKNLFIKREEVLTACDMDHLVESVTGLYAERAKKSNIRLDLKLNAKTILSVRDSLLRQVVSNLLINAIDALDLVIREEKKILVKTSIKADCWILDIEDNALGIEPENAHKIFSLFATSKSEGTGIGLWLSRFIAEQHGGTITFHNTEKGGVVFSVQLPIAAYE